MASTRNSHVTITYHISTGNKSEYYTLWREKEVDLRPRDEDGNITEHFRVNSVGGNMHYHCHINFLQNLSKTKEGAIAKVREMGLDIPDSAFEFDLKHYSRPSFDAFGVSMKHRKGRDGSQRWYAEATPQFWESWRANKAQMKELGWSCWKDTRSGRPEVWYMGIRTTE